MLSKIQLQKIREHLEKSQNPLFFFDNDVDGLCSFLILQRAIGRGKGVAVKSFPDLNKSYLRKIDELNPDYVFILDKPKVSKDFIEGVYEKSIPIVWIDHHDIQSDENNIKLDKELIKKVDYYNPAITSNTSEPVTYLAQKIFNKKEDLWIAMIGCIGDVYMPDFAEKFSKENPELFPSPSKISAFDSLYLTKIGKIVSILNFGLKDTTTNVLKLMRFLLNAKSAYDILEETTHTKYLHYRYNQLNKTYQKLLDRAELQNQGNKNPHLIFFEYGGETSMSSEISNRLYFKHKDKIIIVAYKKPDKANISIRGENARDLTLKAIKNIENASGGGHKQACGAQVPIDKLDKFKENFKNLVENIQDS